MTTYLDYKSNPAENTMAPPVGAPENLPANQVNNIQREMMSVIRQLGDSTEADINALGTMAEQDADAVAITGGTVNADHAGSGAGLTALPAAQLTGAGAIPKEIFPTDTTPLDVKVARATIADTLGPAGALAILPIGTVIMWFGLQANIPAGWALCDGTNGTPNLVGRYPLGAGPGVELNQQGGEWFANVATDNQGSHSHAGTTAAVALTLGQMPAHSHFDKAGGGAGGSAVTSPVMVDATTIYQSNQGTSVAGNNEAHAHGIGADGNHAHNVNVPLAVPYTALFFIMRVS